MGKLETSLDIVNRPGFPLQTHIEDAVRRTQQEHGWYYLKHEHRFRHALSGQTGFTDLILGRQLPEEKPGKWYRFRLVIECRCIAGSWVFLLPRQELSPLASALDRFRRQCEGFSRLPKAVSGLSVQRQLELRGDDN